MDVRVCMCMSESSCPIDSINSKAGRQAQSRSAMTMTTNDATHHDATASQAVLISMCFQSIQSMHPSVIGRHTYIHRPTQSWRPAEISLPLHFLQSRAAASSINRQDTGRQDTAAVCLLCVFSRQPTPRSIPIDLIDPRVPPCPPHGRHHHHHHHQRVRRREHSESVTAAAASRPPSSSCCHCPCSRPAAWPSFPPRRPRHCRRRPRRCSGSCNSHRSPTRAQE